MTAEGVIKLKFKKSNRYSNLNLYVVDMDDSKTYFTVTTTANNKCTYVYDVLSTRTAAVRWIDVGPPMIMDPDHGNQPLYGLLQWFSCVCSNKYCNPIFPDFSASNYLTGDCYDRHWRMLYGEMEYDWILRDGTILVSP
jgi:hypothetical protein